MLLKGDRKHDDPHPPGYSPCMLMDIVDCGTVSITLSGLAKQHDDLHPPGHM